MIEKLSIKDFSLFKENQLKFSKGINVFIGENGTGKSHLLKLLYASAKSISMRYKEHPVAPNKIFLEKEIAERLQGVFRPDSIGHLCNHIQGKSRADINIKFNSTLNDYLHFSFSAGSKEKVHLVQIPKKWNTQMPIFLPTREILSLYPGFISLYESTDIPFEETWRDLAILLGKPLLRGNPSSHTNDLLTSTNNILDGSVELDNNKFYLKSKRGRVEMYLVAEGLRKISMLARLISNGSLKKGTTLFWDEPEANLNPKIIRETVKIITFLSTCNIQVFIATHSLFLIRQLYIEQQKINVKNNIQYFGIRGNEYAGGTIISGDTPDAIGDITSLDEQIIQDEDLMDMYSSSF